MSQWAHCGWLEFLNSILMSREGEMVDSRKEPTWSGWNTVASALMFHLMLITAVIFTCFAWYGSTLHTSVNHYVTVWIFNQLVIKHNVNIILWWIGPPSMVNSQEYFGKRCDLRRVLSRERRVKSCMWYNSYILEVWHLSIFNVRIFGQNIQYKEHYI